MEITTKGFRLDLSSAQWFKSSWSGPNCDNCVEVAFVGQAIAVRDSKNPESVLAFPQDAWSGLVQRLNR